MNNKAVIVTELGFSPWFVVRIGSLKIKPLLTNVKISIESFKVVSFLKFATKVTAASF
jgi:3-deoxy-D-manno-octulosonic-acid transferase